MHHTRLPQSNLGHKCRQSQQTPQPHSPKKCIKYVQDIIGTLLKYGGVVDLTILPGISAIASQQAQGMEAIANACLQLLDYVATHPNAGIRYLASNIILVVHTNASYLSKYNARS
jgi:hypothetical protein